MLKNKPNYAFWILPIAVYGMVFGFAEIIALAGNCFGWWENCWSRQDSGLYLEIAQQGHTLTHCGIENGYEEGSDKWCGNAGWAPFYPLLMFVFNKITSLPLPVCGVLISHVCFLTYLYVCSSLIEIRSWNYSNWLTLLLCAIIPGGFYFFAIFPMSLVVLLISSLFWSIQKSKWQLAGISAFILALSYSSALVIFFCFGVFLVFLFFKNYEGRNLKTFGTEIKKQVSAGNLFRPVLTRIFLPGILGLLVLYSYDYLVTGHWDAMFKVQSKYGHLLYSPFKHLGGHFKLFVEHKNTNLAWIDFHNIFFFFAIPVLIMGILKSKGPMIPLIIIFMLIMWYIPFSIGINVSLYRGISLLAPCMVFLHPLSSIKKLSILVVFGVFYYFLGELFILSILK